jgi:hypothetical protein
VFAVAAIAAALLSGGCSVSDDESPDEMTRTGPLPAEPGPDGRLDADPSPVTLKDVGRQPPGSPQRVVMQLVFFVQWGNLPATTDLYDARIVAGLGRDRIVNGYGWLSPTLGFTRPQIRDTRTEGENAFVNFELLSKRFPPTRETVVLRRRGKDWRIAWDTLLARSLSGVALASQAPNPAKPNLSARRAAEAEERRYRTLAASVARGVELP